MKTIPKIVLDTDTHAPEDVTSPHIPPADCPIVDTLFRDEEAGNTLDLTDNRDGTFEICVSIEDARDYEADGYCVDNLTAEDLTRIAQALNAAAAFRKLQS